jgi:hypothetical protein
MINLDKMIISRHARKQIKWRRITEKEVGEVISNPDRLEDAIKGRKNAFKLIGRRLLKITYTVETDGIIIITAMVKKERNHENRI